MVSLQGTVLLALVLALFSPPAMALGGLDLQLLVRDVDHAVGGTVHGALAPVEAPASAPASTMMPASGASHGDDLESSGTATAPARVATMPQADASFVLWPWVVTLGAAFVGVGASAVRGPLSRVRDDGFALFWRVLLGGAVRAIGSAPASRCAAGPAQERRA